MMGATLRPAGAYFWCGISTRSRRFYLLGDVVWKCAGKSLMPPFALIRPYESVMVYVVSSGFASDVYVNVCHPSGAQNGPYVFHV